MRRNPILSFFSSKPKTQPQPAPKEKIQKDKDLELLELAKSGNDIAINFKLLIKEGANYNAIDENGWTPLMHVACNGSNNILGAFFDPLHDNLEINAINEDGKTALMLAIEKNPKNSAIFLTELKKFCGEAQVDYLHNIIKDKAGETALFKAVKINDLDLVKLLAFRRIKDLNPTNQDTSKENKPRYDIDIPTSEHGTTPLILAVLNNNEDIVEFLISKGADVNNCDESQFNALNYAIMNKNPKIAQLLIKAGSKITIPENLAEDFGKFGFWSIDNEIKNQTEQILESFKGIKNLVQNIENLKNNEEITIDFFPSLSSSTQAKKSSPSEEGLQPLKGPSSPQNIFGKLSGAGETIGKAATNFSSAISSPSQGMKSLFSIEGFQPIDTLFFDSNQSSKKTEGGEKQPAQDIFSDFSQLFASKQSPEKTEGVEIANDQEPILEAAANNNFSLVKSLIESGRFGVDYYSEYSGKQTNALILAENYKINQPELLNLIIDYENELENVENQTVFDEQNSTCLVQFLVRSGADINELDSSGKSALGYSIYNFALRNISSTTNEILHLSQVLLGTSKDDESQKLDKISSLDLVTRNLQLVKDFKAEKDNFPKYNENELEAPENSPSDSILETEEGQALDSIKKLVEEASKSVLEVRNIILMQQLEKSRQRTEQKGLKDFHPSSSPSTKRKEEILKGSVIEAVKNKNLELIKKLLFEDKADINDVDINGCNALMFAVNHRPELIPFLMKFHKEREWVERMNFKLDFQARDSRGRTVSMLAVENYITGRGDTSKEIENLIKELYPTLEDKSSAEKEWLIKNINSRDANGLSVLMQTIKGCVDEKGKKLVGFLLNRGSEVNQKDFSDRTPLMHAARNNSCPWITEILLKKGADSNSKDIDGKLAIDFAKNHKMWVFNEENQSKIIGLLEEAESKKDNKKIELFPTIFDAIKNYPEEDLSKQMLAWAELNELLGDKKNQRLRNENGYNLFMFAAENKPQLLKTLLDLIPKSGEKINEKIAPFNQTALMILIKSSRVIPENSNEAEDLKRNILGGLECLIDAGANPNIGDINGRNALMYAIEYRPEIVCDLIDQEKEREGKNFNKIFDFNAKDNNGNTALMLVVSKKSINFESKKKIIEKLTEKNANVNAKNHSGFDALMIAADYSDDARLVIYLVDKGAKTDQKYQGDKKAHEVLSERNPKNGQIIDFLKSKSLEETETKSSEDSRDSKTRSAFRHFHYTR
jgi:ankyrin repeat protein